MAFNPAIITLDPAYGRPLCEHVVHDTWGACDAVWAEIDPNVSGAPFLLCDPCKQGRGRRIGATYARVYLRGEVPA